MLIIYYDLLVTQNAWIIPGKPPNKVKITLMIKSLPKPLFKNTERGGKIIFNKIVISDICYDFLIVCKYRIKQLLVLIQLKF